MTGSIDWSLFTALLVFHDWSQIYPVWHSQTLIMVDYLVARSLFPIHIIFRRRHTLGRVSKFLHPPSQLAIGSWFSATRWGGAADSTGQRWMNIWLSLNPASGKGSAVVANHYYWIPASKPTSDQHHPPSIWAADRAATLRSKFSNTHTQPPHLAESNRDTGN